MATKSVSAQTADGASVEFPYDFGDNLQETLQLFGEDVVYNHAYRSLVIAAQAFARSLIRQGLSDKDIIAKMETWKPGMPREAKTPEQKVRELLANMSPEQRAEIAAVLKAAPAKGGKAA